MNKQIKIGILLGAVTAFISGFSIFYNKLVIVKGIDPLIFNIIKNGGVAVILSLFFLRPPSFKKLITLSQNQWKKLILIGLIGGSIPFILYFEGLKTVAATNANLIHKTLFLWVAAMAIPFLGEKLNIWQIVGYLLVATSNIFIGGFSGFTGSTAEIMILAATILWSVENIIAKITLKDLDSNIVAWGRMFLGCIFLILFAVWQNKLGLLLQLKPEQAFPILGSIVFLTGYVITWYKALKLAPATLVTSVLIISTPITNVLSAIFITHALPQVQMVNGAVSILGVLIISYFAQKTDKKIARAAVK